MQTRVRTAIILLTITGVAGIWLVLAPFVSGYQPSGAPWITATVHHVATGAILAVVSFASVLTVLGGALRSLDATSDAEIATMGPSHLPLGEPERHEEEDPWNRG